MEKVQLLPHQTKALEAIQSALLRGQKNMVVEMATGTGKIAVLIKTLEFLHTTQNKKILVVVKHLSIKEQLINELSTKYSYGNLISKRKYLKICLEEILSLLNIEHGRRIKVIKLTKDGNPVNPLYQSKTSVLIDYIKD